MCAAVRRAHISFCRLTEARCVEHTSGDGRSWKVGGAKMARSDKVKREIYTRELGGRHIQIYIIQKSDDTRTEKGCVDSDSLLLRNFRRFDGRYIES